MLLPLLGFSLASLALLKLGSLLVWVAVLALALKLSLVTIVALAAIDDVVPGRSGHGVVAGSGIDDHRTGHGDSGQVQRVGCRSQQHLDPAEARGIDGLDDVDPRRVRSRNRLLDATAVLLGAWLWLGYGIGRGQGWMHAKLFVVLLVIGYHHACAVLLRKISRGESTRSHVWFRWFNEAPVLLMLAAVVLVVVKPF